MKRLKKILSAALAFAMVLSLVVVPAYAENDAEQGSADEEVVTDEVVSADEADDEDKAQPPAVPSEDGADGSQSDADTEVTEPDGTEPEADAAGSESDEMNGTNEQPNTENSDPASDEQEDMVSEDGKSEETDAPADDAGTDGGNMDNPSTDEPSTDEVDTGESSKTEPAAGVSDENKSADGETVVDEPENINSEISADGSDEVEPGETVNEPIVTDYSAEPYNDVMELAVEPGFVWDNFGMNKISEFGLPADGVWSSSDESVVSMDAMTGAMTFIDFGECSIFYAYTNADGAEETAMWNITVGVTPAVMSYGAPSTASGTATGELGSFTPSGEYVYKTPSTYQYYHRSPVRV